MKDKLTNLKAEQLNMVKQAEAEVAHGF